MYLHLTVAIANLKIHVLMEVVANIIAKLWVVWQSVLVMMALNWLKTINIVLIWMNALSTMPDVLEHV